MGSRKRENRCTSAEKTERIARCAELVAQGWQRRMAKILAAQWNCDPKTVEGYVSEARRLMAADRLTLEQMRDEHLARARLIGARALAAGEFRAAVSALDTETKIAGTSAPQRHEVTGKDGAPLFPADHPLGALGRPPTIEELRAYVERDEVPQKPN
jgi:hypothetical protein